jgi:hypothetical protein
LGDGGFTGGEGGLENIFSVTIGSTSIGSNSGFAHGEGTFNDIFGIVIGKLNRLGDGGFALGPGTFDNIIGIIVSNSESSGDGRFAFGEGGFKDIKGIVIRPTRILRDGGFTLGEGSMEDLLGIFISIFSWGNNTYFRENSPKIGGLVDSDFTICKALYLIAVGLGDLNSVSEYNVERGCGKIVFSDVRFGSAPSGVFGISAGSLSSGF